jgi:hypothetical protein
MERPHKQSPSCRDDPCDRGTGRRRSCRTARGPPKAADATRGGRRPGSVGGPAALHPSGPPRRDPAVENGVDTPRGSGRRERGTGPTNLIALSIEFETPGACAQFQVQGVSVLSRFGRFRDVLCPGSRSGDVRATAGVRSMGWPEVDPRLPDGVPDPGSIDRARPARRRRAWPQEADPRGQRLVSRRRRPDHARGRGDAPRDRRLAGMSTPPLRSLPGADRASPGGAA